MGELYIKGLLFTLGLAGTFWLYFVGHILFKYCVSFVTDSDFKPTYLLKKMVKKISGHSPYDGTDAIMMSVLILLMSVLCVLFWPFFMLGVVVFSTLLGLRYIARLKKKIDKLSKKQDHEMD